MRSPLRSELHALRDRLSHTSGEGNCFKLHKARASLQELRGMIHES